jgi:hypothetical protein
MSQMYYLLLTGFYVKLGWIWNGIVNILLTFCDRVNDGFSDFGILYFMLGQALYNVKVTVKLRVYAPLSL